MPKLREPVIYGDATVRSNGIERSGDSLRDALNVVPFLDGVLYSPGTALTVGSNVIAHRLGRTPKGWILLRATGAATSLYEESRGDKYITLNSSGAAVPEIWFF